MSTSDYELKYFDGSNTREISYKRNGYQTVKMKDWRPFGLSVGEYVGRVSGIGSYEIEDLAIVIDCKKDKIWGFVYTLFIVRTNRTETHYYTCKPRPKEEWKDYTIVKQESGPYVWPLTSKGKEVLGHYFDEIDLERKESVTREYLQEEEKILEKERVTKIISRIRNTKRRETLVKNTGTTKVFNISTGTYLSKKTCEKRRSPIYINTWKSGQSEIPITCREGDQDFFLKVKELLEKNTIDL
jgi:hypothetical protein